MFTEFCTDRTSYGWLMVRPRWTWNKQEIKTLQCDAMFQMEVPDSCVGFSCGRYGAHGNTPHHHYHSLCLTHQTFGVLCRYNSLWRKRGDVYMWSIFIHRGDYLPNYNSKSHIWISFSPAFHCLPLLPATAHACETWACGDEELESAVCIVYVWE